MDEQLHALQRHIDATGQDYSDEHFEALRGDMRYGEAATYVLVNRFDLEHMM